MKPIPWAAVAWFAVSIIALGMSINTFRSAAEPLHGQAPPSVQAPNPAPSVRTPSVSQGTQGAVATQALPDQKRLFIAAGDKLLKCVVNGQVTYTNDPQECPTGAAASMTVHPTKGYLATKP